MLHALGLEPTTFWPSNLQLAAAVSLLMAFTHLSDNWPCSKLAETHLGESNGLQRSPETTSRQSCSWPRMCKASNIIHPLLGWQAPTIEARRQNVYSVYNLSLFSCFGTCRKNISNQDLSVVTVPSPSFFANALEAICPQCKWSLSLIILWHTVYLFAQ